MSNLEWFFVLMTLIGLAGSYWVYRHDKHKAKR
jgi:cbb3-type cytochrome oxidase subunit 3